MCFFVKEHKMSNFSGASLNAYVIEFAIGVIDELLKIEWGGIEKKERSCSGNHVCVLIKFACYQTRLKNPLRPIGARDQGARGPESRPPAYREMR